MDSQSTPVISAAKLPILNPNEFDLWKIRIEQYFLMTDYSLWEVIINGDSLKPSVVVEGSAAPIVILTAEQNLARRNELKARGTLLMALPDKHQLKFNSYKDAKTLMEVIEKRFGGTLKLRKLQKLISQLEIHRVYISQKDVNLKFLRSLPSEWKTHTLIWRNKTNIEEHNLDDLFNSLRIYEAEVKHSSFPGNLTQNIAFVSSSNIDSTTDSISAATSVSTICAQLPVSSHPNIDSLSFDMSKVECYNCHRKGHFARECRSPKDIRRTVVTEPQRRHIPVETSTSNALASQCDGIGSYDWSYQAEEEPTNFDLMAISSLRSSDNEDNIIMLKNEVAARDHFISIIKQKLKEAKTERDDLKLKFENFQSSSKNLAELIASQTNNKHGLGYLPSEDVSANLSLSCPSDMVQPIEGYNAVPPPITGNFILALLSLHKPCLTQLNQWHLSLRTGSDSEDESEPIDPKSAPSFVQPSEHIKLFGHSAQSVEAPILDHTPKPTISKTNGSRKRKNRKTCFVCMGVDHLIKDCTFHAKPKTQPTPRNYAHRGYDKQYASSTKRCPQTHRVPAAVFTKSKPIFVTDARPVSADVPKILTTKPRHAHSLHTKTNSIIRRHKTPSKFSKTSNSSPKATAAHAKVVSTAKGKKRKWDKGVIDSGCSRHMTWNMSYFSDFQELNGGYVTFGGNPKGGKITGKGKIKTDFKLPDETQVLLRVPRENNMYNVNLKDIVPSGDLTCLFAKATIYESNLWHRRLGYLNLKTINELVKGNLVRGLPTKVFENQNTCVACRKGKQHRASCKTKPVSSVTQPLFRLHMHLFGPTFVKSLNKKCYSLVIIDDYTRFIWVFFLATKDETSSILKTFVTGIENQLTLKAEAVNTACYVQNRVLVTKPQNKTPYELLHGCTPSIGFMRPFGCPVTILNTLDSLGKFEGKVDERFPVGYSVHSKAFRVFNSRTRIVQETLHVNFLENTPTVVGTGPTRYFDGTTHGFEDFSKDSSNDVSVAGPIVPAAGQNCSNSTNPISAAGPSNSNSSSTHGNSSLIDAF
uniref:Ribonuclease H-like domain-containing protein n=1 Tax=Tanacetum cinerariifolium TaxID=118510 RepID=A0A6L2N6W7_TANCI|nr:ribonuclease H-like domain-containing protein [Tanacetum cinerariifolium]